uniref:Vacuolar protein-sorting-associated protein 36 n=1 Tax=Ogataea thermomethanolica (nom. inval.) TaxID=310468 RepID=A0A5P8D0W8_9ASCO|nr:vacuolar protein-sorting-associated protein 36 [Ogataea thermomethanolica (nom. inval.)]QGW56837.1 vacuolar protein-sorting-associated protein 36 [Ogataea thermomethanolica (nom. inval.)]
MNDLDLSPWKITILTGGGRPRLLPLERELLVEGNIGIYRGDAKVNGYQKGRVYLTTLRLIYVSHFEKPLKQRDALELSLECVRDVKYQSGFMKTSPKIILSTISVSSTNQSLDYDTYIVWVCAICHHENNSGLKTLSQHDVPRCEKCGVSADVDVINRLKLQSLNQLKRRESLDEHLSGHSICDEVDNIHSKEVLAKERNTKVNKGEELEGSNSGRGNQVSFTFYKLSFRSGGSKSFLENLQKAIESSKWTNMESRYQVNAGSLKYSRLNQDTSFHQSKATPTSNQQHQKYAGIHGLQKQTSLRNLEISSLLNNSLSDLQNLMDKSIELAKVGEQYRKTLIDNKVAKRTTSDTLKMLSCSRNSMKLMENMLADQRIAEGIDNFYQVEALNLLKCAESPSRTTEYIYELSRQIYDFITEKELLNDGHQLVTVLDLYCLYNKSKGFYSVSPADFLSAIKLFSTLGFDFQLLELPLDHHKDLQHKGEHISSFRCLRVVCRSSTNTTSITNTILDILTLQNTKGYSALELQNVALMNLNLVLLQSLLNSLIKSGSICYDFTVEGERYFVNHIIDFDWDSVNK